jgi:hypothetical protein
MKNKICVRCGMEYPDHKMSCKIPVEEWRLPTAEEFLIKNEDSDFRLSKSELNVSDMMIEFAKLHVEAQKEAILENITIVISNREVIIDKNSIKNAYPLNNIK